MRENLATLARFLGCSVPAGSERVWVEGVAFDSREVHPGDLFVAVPGEKTDGHLFVSDAASRGAVAALVAQPVASPLPQLVVPDPVAALQRVASRIRRGAGFKVVAVTGSVGKTTTKGMVAALLARHMPVAETRGSRNSQVGLPAEICNVAGEIAWFVAEAGMSHKGELSRLGEVLRPDALLYTRIAPVHLEFFPSLDAIAEAKAELIPFLSREGLLVVNAADPLQASFPSRFAGRVRRYGTPGASDLWVAERISQGLLGTRFTLAAPGLSVPVELPLPGPHQVENFLAAACLALALGVPPEDLPEAARHLRPQPHRGEIHRLPSGAILVDDSYNASPVAVAAMLELLGQTPGTHVAVLGEMLELGEASPRFHQEIGERARATCQKLVTVGGENARLAAAAYGSQGVWVPTWEEAVSALGDDVREGDVVLVKGSRGIGLDRLVDALLGRR